MAGEAREERKRRALDELVTLVAPLRDFGPGVRRAVEQAEAQGVADAPVVEVAAPAVHLRGGDARRLVDKRRQHPGLVPAGVPEGGGELVAAPELLRQHLDVGHRHTEGFARRDAEPRQILAIAFGALLLEPRKRRLNLLFDRLDFLDWLLALASSLAFSFSSWRACVYSGYGCRLVSGVQRTPSFSSILMAPGLFGFICSDFL